MDTRGILKLKWWLPLLMVGLLACENSEEELRERVKKKMGVDEARQVETFFSQAGNVKAKLTSPLMYRYQDTPRVEFPEKLHVDFYNDSLQIESTLDALYGRYLDGQNKMFLRDSVIVIQKVKQDTLRCQELWWDQNQQKFYTDKPVRITKVDGTVLPGEGLEASQDFKSFKIIKPANAILPLGEDPFAAFDSTTTAAPDTTVTAPR
ncbi:MAG: LPS export ABC transporter periplasmic protein LptC [Chitinophagaceae bacterium]|nr:LPS export ABC transporter periplasmic protein LptC [Chitinophagaceae bacterium]MCW5928568.1 LPS export ABC transporter periplasmic protein LptC [Chitinophagaceae bacterium]